MQTVLLTGFEPFHAWPINPSAQVVQTLSSDPPPNLDLRTTILPVSFTETAPILTAAIDQSPPDLILMLAQAAASPAPEKPPSMALEVQVAGVRAALDFLTRP